LRALSLNFLRNRLDFDFLPVHHYWQAVKGRGNQSSGAVGYFPNTFFKSAVVWEAGLVRILASSRPILTKRPSTDFSVT
jgi:hypothetical protein